MTISPLLLKPCLPINLSIEYTKSAGSFIVVYSPSLGSFVIFFGKRITLLVMYY